jgi:hypothetical protein
MDALTLTVTVLTAVTVVIVVTGVMRCFGPRQPGRDFQYVFLTLKCARLANAFADG